MVKKTLRILDLTSEKKEGMSEGLLLYELMRILGYENNVELEYVKGKRHFLELLNEAKETYIHIGAHGDVKAGKTTLLTSRGAKITPSDLNDVWIKRKRKPQLIVLSVCHAGHIDLEKAFSKAGVRYVIAPLHETYWDDAAIFSGMFYKLLIGEEKTPWISYRNAKCGFEVTFKNLSGAWRFYKNGRHIQVEC